MNRIIFSVLVLIFPLFSFAEDVPSDILEAYTELRPIVIKFQQNGDLAPLAYSIDKTGELKGDALINKEGEEDISMEFALSHFQKKYQDSAKKGSIKLAAVFFHGNAQGSAVKIVNKIAEVNAFIAYIESKSSSYTIVTEYSCEESEKCTYQKPKFFKTPPQYFK